MLRSVKEMLNHSILATDGEIGQVSDVLVGDSDLKLRYLVIDTGGWLPGRKVLLSTAWLGSVEPSNGKESGRQHRKEADQGVAALRVRHSA
jgi:hypothetical protein